MSIRDMGAWVTDFMGYPDTIREEEKKDRLLQFIRYGLKENPGVIALAISILGVNHLVALEVFCNIHTSLKSAGRVKSNCVYVNRQRLREVLKEKRISYTVLAERVGCGRQTINNIFYSESGRKGKQFVYKMEAALELPKGSLILEVHSNEKSNNCWI